MSQFVLRQHDDFQIQAVLGQLEGASYARVGAFGPGPTVVAVHKVCSGIAVAMCDKTHAIYYGAKFDLHIRPCYHCAYSSTHGLKVP